MRQDFVRRNKAEYNLFKVLPAPGFSEMKLLDEILSKESLCQEEDRFDQLVKFFKLICNLPTYYWEYYYRAENSSLRLSFLMRLTITLKRNWSTSTPDSAHFRSATIKRQKDF